jgi:hypothetical protein
MMANVHAIPPRQQMGGPLHGPQMGGPGPNGRMPPGPPPGHHQQQQQQQQQQQHQQQHQQHQQHPQHPQHQPPPPGPGPGPKGKDEPGKDDAGAGMGLGLGLGGDFEFDMDAINFDNAALTMSGFPFDGAESMNWLANPPDSLAMDGLK